MLTPERYEYLRNALEQRPVQFPERRTLKFIDGFAPVHLQCHLTAMQVAVETGWPPVVGIQFINLHGKLYPWPHMVNRAADGTLVDCSPVPNQPVLGFIETGWDELDAWRQIIIAYNAFGSRTDAPHWGDPLADRLTVDFLPALCRPVAVAPSGGPDLRDARPEARPEARIEANRAA